MGWDVDDFLSVTSSIINVFFRRIISPPIFVFRFFFFSSFFSFFFLPADWELVDEDNFKFTHDRFSQAAMMLADPMLTEKIHFSIAEMLMNNSSKY